ncbi:hypothetical protein [Alkalicoccobacillus gibsonii]|uniref:hypothetical protein n=1 Tax=Alkalicoccobacillus gibsonii TaxID=79881 RepID=UPI003512A3A2
MTWDDLKYFGYGLLQLTPDQLFKFTVHEIFDMVVAYYRRRDSEIEEQMQVLSWQTSHLMNASGNYKKPIKPDQLYSPKQSDEEGGNSELTPIDRDEKNAKLADLKAKFKD